MTYFTLTATSRTPTSRTRGVSAFLFCAAGLAMAAGAAPNDDADERADEYSAAGAKAEVSLEPVLPSETERRLRWSPRGTQIEWSEELPDDFPGAFGRFADEQADPVFGWVTLGPEDAEPRPFILARTEAGTEYRERLVIDTAGNGRVDESRDVFDVEAHESRGRMWVSHGGVVLDIIYSGGASPGGGDIVVPHEFSFWHTYPREGEQRDRENILRFSRRSWMEGVAELHGNQFRVQVIDARNNARYTTDDRWTLELVDGGEADEASAAENASSDESGDADAVATYTSEPRTGMDLDEPFFIDGQAYRLTDVAISGTRAVLKPTDDVPEIPEEDDTPDRPQSEHELAWLDDLDEGRQQAERREQPMLVKWTAVWCGPCRRMDREAFRDRVVVDLLRESFVIVEIDRDEQHELGAEHEIRALPTMQIFTPDGEEVDRRRGLQSPEQMEQWLTEYAE